MRQWVLSSGLNVKTAVVNGSSHRKKQTELCKFDRQLWIKALCNTVGSKKINPDEIRIWILALSNALCLSIHPPLPLSLFHVTTLSR